MLSCGATQRTKGTLLIVCQLHPVTLVGMFHAAASLEIKPSPRTRMCLVTAPANPFDYR